MGKTISCVAFVILFISATANAQTTHIVGGNSGWTTGQNYDTWARGRTFSTGDTLSFTYGPSHDVAEVNQADYDSCGTGNPISVVRASPTRITLSSSDTRYFICSLSNHCDRGMKVTITVATGTATPSPPTGGATPSPPTSTNTPPSSATPSTPTPNSRPPPTAPAGGGASSLGGKSVFVVGLSVILAAVVL